jgi:hypothetical protein
MKMSVRGWFVVGAFAAGVAALAILNSPLVDAAPPRAKSAGQLTEESLGRALASLGLSPKKQDQRYDFAFQAKQGKQEWELSMSAVLSEDGQSIWVMAWLDELPRSAAEVPRTALLRLLADNDQLGGGKFFAYVAGNRRFVLQRVIANRNITADGFRTMLGDLGRSVVDTHSHWSVASWKSGGKGQPSAARTASGQSTSSGGTTQK